MSKQTDFDGCWCQQVWRVHTSYDMCLGVLSAFRSAVLTIHQSAGKLLVLRMLGTHITGSKYVVLTRIYSSTCSTFTTLHLRYDSSYSSTTASRSSGIRGLETLPLIGSGVRSGWSHWLKNYSEETLSGICVSVPRAVHEKWRCARALLTGVGQPCAEKKLRVRLAHGAGILRADPSNRYAGAHVSSRSEHLPETCTPQ